MNSTPWFRNFVLRGLRVFNSGGSFDSPVDVVVENGAVAAVRENAKTSVDHVEVDANGLWLMPGVIDCHAHVAVPSFDAWELLNMPMSQRMFETAAGLRRTLEAGVTFLRDAAGADAGVRDSVAAGLVPGPRLQVSVVGLGQTGGHGDGYINSLGIELPNDAMVPEYPGRPPYLVDGPQEMRKAVRKVLRSGADWIKLFATGGVMSARPGTTASELTKDELVAAVTTASGRCRGVMVHAFGGLALSDAVHAGVSSIEHGIDLTEEQAADMATRGCVLVPTLAIYHELVDLADRGELPGQAVPRALDVGGRLGEAVQIARAAGVPVALGTDWASRSQHGRNLEEIAHLHRAGLTPEEALLAATATGADLCGVAERRGRIAPGYAFDALLLDDDPSDLTVFSRPGGVTGVFLDGWPAVRHPRLPASPSVQNEAPA